MNKITENILRFFVLILLQVLVFNNIQYFALCTPYIYVLFLICLPINLPRWADILIGFFTGMIIDIFCNTLGIHTFACTAVCYFKYHAVRWFVDNVDRIQGTPSSSAFLGIEAFFKFIVLLVIIHHTCVIMLEAFTFQHFWWALLQIIVSSTITITLIMIYDLLKN